MIYEKTKAKDIFVEPNQISDTVASTIKEMATIVGATLGPGGRPVLIERDGKAPLITKDGVTVARSLGMAQAERNIIVEAAKEICINTAKEAGDGTTTAIVLANAIVQAGHDFMKNNKKYNPQRIVNELQTIYKEIIEPTIRGISKVADTEDKLRQVASVSANGDNELAKHVVEAVIAAGDDGQVLIHENQGKETYVDTVDGYVITSGLKEIGQLAPIFMNKPGEQASHMDNGLVFCYNGSLQSLDVLARIQTAIEESMSGGGVDLMGKPIIFLAHEFTQVILDKLAKHAKDGHTFIPVTLPMSGLKNSRTITLNDIAAYTSAQVADPGNIAEFDVDWFGEFESAKVNTFETFIISEPEEDKLDIRVSQLKTMLSDAEAANDEYSEMHLKAHIGRLTGGISTLLVGGASNLEIREKRDRAEDAVEAVRSAIAEGVVAGGCHVQREIIDALNAKKEELPESSIILLEALSAPFKLLLENCGEDYEEILGKLKSGKIFDANAHKMVDPFKAGIIEPSKVARVSIGNALSVASLLITLGGMVVVPRDSSLENQLALSQNAFKSMMDAQ